MYILITYTIQRLFNFNEAHINTYPTNNRMIILYPNILPKIYSVRAYTFFSISSLFIYSD